MQHHIAHTTTQVHENIIGTQRHPTEQRIDQIEACLAVNLGWERLIVIQLIRIEYGPVINEIHEIFDESIRGTIFHILVERFQPSEPQIIFLN